MKRAMSFHNRQHRVAIPNYVMVMAGTFDRDWIRFCWWRLFFLRIHENQQIWLTFTIYMIYRHKWLCRLCVSFSNCLSTCAKQIHILAKVWSSWVWLANHFVYSHKIVKLFYYVSLKGIICAFLIRAVRKTITPQFDAYGYLPALDVQRVLFSISLVGIYIYFLGRCTNRVRA